MTNLTPASVIDVRSLSGTRETVAYQDGGLFPVMGQTAGGAAVAVLRGGAGHIGRAGRMELVRSLDAGRTWSPPYTLADSEDDDRNPAFGVSQKGTLVLLYHRQHNYDAAGNYLGRTSAVGRRPVAIMATRSFDGGLSWEEPFPLSIDDFQSGSPYGKIVSLSDGTLLAPIYSCLAWADPQAAETTDNAYVVRSRDDGKSWERFSLIAGEKNETALIVLPGDEVLAVLRGADSSQGLHSAHSRDGGRTWTETTQITQPRQHPADLERLSDGSILLTYGNRNPPYRIEGRISRDGGRSWLDLLLVFSGHLYGYTVEESRRTDLGYPSSVRRDRAGVTMYYYNPSMRAAQDARQSTGNPLYQHRNYCAVAVTWREDELLAAVEHALSSA